MFDSYFLTKVRLWTHFQTTATYLRLKCCDTRFVSYLISDLFPIRPNPTQSAPPPKSTRFQMKGCHKMSAQFRVKSIENDIVFPPAAILTWWLTQFSFSTKYIYSYKVANLVYEMLDCSRNRYSAWFTESMLDNMAHKNEWHLPLSFYSSRVFLGYLEKNLNCDSFISNSKN